MTDPAHLLPILDHDQLNTQCTVQGIETFSPPKSNARVAPMALRIWRIDLRTASR